MFQSAKKMLQPVEIRSRCVLSVRRIGITLKTILPVQDVVPLINFRVNDRWSDVRRLLSVRPRQDNMRLRFRFLSYFRPPCRDELQAEARAVGAALRGHAIAALKSISELLESVWGAVEGVLKEHAPHLCSLWEAVKKLDATHDLILDSWESWTDILAKTNKGNVSTKEASSFTLARCAQWPGTLRTWLGKVHVQLPAHAYDSRERLKHSLCGIAGQVDEVGDDCEAGPAGYNASIDTTRVCTKASNGMSQCCVGRN